jgi:hypothetical protein
MAKAMGWAARVMTVSFEMVLPGFAGIWVDGRLGTKVLFTLLGFAAGMTIAILHLLRMTKSVATRTPDESNVERDSKSNHGGTDG